MVRAPGARYISGALQRAGPGCGGPAGIPLQHQRITPRGDVRDGRARPPGAAHCAAGCSAAPAARQRSGRRPLPPRVWRVGFAPDPAMLSTAAARDPGMLAWSRTVHATPPTWAGLRSIAEGSTTALD